MRRALVLLAAMVFSLAVMAGPALAMQPPGEAAQDNFGCVDGEGSAVAGHPGAEGLTDAAPRVGGLTGDPTPTAWNAVEHADPIELGSC